MVWWYIGAWRKRSRMDVCDKWRPQGANQEGGLFDCLRHGARRIASYEKCKICAELAPNASGGSTRRNDGALWSVGEYMVDVQITKAMDR